MAQAGRRYRSAPARKASHDLMTGKARRYEVLLTQSAEQDLESIHDYIAEFDWTPVGVVTLNPERNAVVREHVDAEVIERLVA